MSQFELVEEFVSVSEEDELTKAVFGCLELLSPEALNSIFQHLKLGVSAQARPEFTFHEIVDRREPDVIIEDGQNFTVMVEAKLGDRTRPNQLADEYADLTENWDSETLKIWHITDDNRQPRHLASQTGILETNLEWSSWRDLASAAIRANPRNSVSTDHRIAAVLTQIFEANGFVPFGGFTLMEESNSLSEQLEQAYEIRKQYYTEINSFRKDVEKNLTDEIRYWRFFRRGVSGGMTSGQKVFPSSSWQNMPQHLWFSYVPSDNVPTLGTRHYHSNYLLLDFDSRSGRIRAGYIMTTAPEKVKDDIFRRTLHEHRDHLKQIIEDHGLQPYTTSYSLNDELKPEDDINSFLERIGDASYDVSEWGKRLLLTQTWTADELPTKERDDDLFEPADVTAEIAEALNRIHQLTFEDYNHIFYPDSE